ncbi:hypothetical protein TrispH2_007121 [Trichoplax sp. H2]|nr:hypothetical protein TrispH2_007121 [Trichoplax sp. H2]|eukprot:RDD40196.1 hypothetical protein TrispH2_007121 [Trichoplax sp. H2]
MIRFLHEIIKAELSKNTFTSNDRDGEHQIQSITEATSDKVFPDNTCHSFRQKGNLKNVIKSPTSQEIELIEMASRGKIPIPGKLSHGCNHNICLSIKNLNSDSDIDKDQSKPIHHPPSDYQQFISNTSDDQLQFWHHQLNAKMMPKLIVSNYDEDDRRRIGQNDCKIDITEKDDQVNKQIDHSGCAGHMDPPTNKYDQTQHIYDEIDNYHNNNRQICDPRYDYPPYDCSTSKL